MEENVLGNYLIETLKNKGMSQADLARELGCTRQMVSGIIHKRWRLSVDLAIKISSILDINVYELLSYQNRDDVHKIIAK